MKNSLIRRERSSSINIANLANAAVTESPSIDKSRYRHFVSYQAGGIAGNTGGGSKQHGVSTQHSSLSTVDHGVIVVGDASASPMPQPPPAPIPVITLPFFPPFVSSSSLSLPIPSAESSVNGSTTFGSMSDDTIMITVDQAIEQIGCGLFQYRVSVAAAFNNATDAMQVMLLSFLSPIFMDVWDLSTEQAAQLTSMIFAGALLGTLIWGPLADQYGRRPVFLISSSVIVTGGIFTTLAPSYGLCTMTIFMLGIGIGGLSVPFDILAEFLPSSGRGTNLLKINYAWTMGVLYVVALAFVFLQGPEPAWRLVSVLCIVPCSIALLIGYIYVPESPHWLASKGRLREAMQVLRLAAQTNGHDSFILFPETTVIQPVWSEKHASMWDLFLPKWRELTLLLWGGWFTSAFGYYGTLLVTTRVFSFSDALDYNAIFVSGCAELVGTTLAIALVDRIGRITTQVWAFWIAGVLLCLLCILAQWDITPRWTLVALSFGARVFEMVGPSVIWISTAEVLPTDIRGTGHCMATAMSRLGAFFCPYLVESETPLIIVGAVMLLAHICTVSCVSRLPETMGRGMGSSFDDEKCGESSPLSLAMSIRSVK